MKKSLLVAIMLFAGMFTYCYGQNVRVNINNQDYSSNKDCEFKINGICSSEDIGGVEIQGLVKFEMSTVYEGEYSLVQYAVLTNYNDFTVTVLVDSYEYGIFSVVLKKNETKEHFVGYRGGGTTKQPSSSYKNQMSIKGMIVRKLGQ